MDIKKSNFCSHHIFSFTFPVKNSSCLTSFCVYISPSFNNYWDSLCQKNFLISEKKLLRIFRHFLCVCGGKIWMKAMKMSFFRAFEGSKYRNRENLTNTVTHLLSQILSHLKNILFLWEKPVECAEKLLLLFTIKDELLLLFLLLFSYHFIHFLFSLPPSLLNTYVCS